MCKRSHSDPRIRAGRYRGSRQWLGSVVATMLVAVAAFGCRPKGQAIRPTQAHHGGGVGGSARTNGGESEVVIGGRGGTTVEPTGGLETRIGGRGGAIVEPAGGANDDGGASNGGATVAPHMECQPGSPDEVGPCEDECGTRTRECGPDGRYGPWSFCENKFVGECLPNERLERPCERCGVMRGVCLSNCMAFWSGTCENQGACEPGDVVSTVASCPAGQVRTAVCTETCAAEYGECQPQPTAAQVEIQLLIARPVEGRSGNQVQLYGAQPTSQLLDRSVRLSANVVGPRTTARPIFSADGRWLLYLGDEDADLGVLQPLIIDTEGVAPKQQVVTLEPHQGIAEVAWSPTSTALALVGDLESDDRDEVYLVALDGEVFDAPRLVSDDGTGALADDAESVAFSEDGQYLAYKRAGRLFVVDVSRTVPIGPVDVFESGLVPGGGGAGAGGAGGFGGVATSTGGVGVAGRAGDAGTMTLGGAGGSAGSDSMGSGTSGQPGAGGAAGSGPALAASVAASMASFDVFAYAWSPTAPVIAVEVSDRFDLGPLELLQVQTQGGHVAAVRLGSAGSQARYRSTAHPWAWSPDGALIAWAEGTGYSAASLTSTGDQWVLGAAVAAEAPPSQPLELQWSPDAASLLLRTASGAYVSQREEGAAFSTLRPLFAGAVALSNWGARRIWSSDSKLVALPGSPVTATAKVIHVVSPSRSQATVRVEQVGAQAINVVDAEWSPVRSLLAFRAEILDGVQELFAVEVLDGVVQAPHRQHASLRYGSSVIEWGFRPSGVEAEN